ncbi:MAG: ABC-2 family transporter protein [Actinomycetota bacterium]
MTAAPRPALGGTGSPGAGDGAPAAPLPRVLWRALTLSARRTAGDAGQLALNAAFYVLVTTVLAQLWKAAAASLGGEIVGYTAVALVWYIAATEMAVNSIPIHLIPEIGDDITTRRIEVELLRPTSVMAVRVAHTVGRVLPRLALLTVIGVPLAWALGGAPPRPITLLLLLPSLVLAMTLNVVLQHAFAALSFWFGEAKSGWFLFQKLVFVGGGMLLPLEVLPQGVAGVARYLPFAAVAYAPGRLSSGHVEPWWLAVQAGWLVVVGGLTAALFTGGLAHMQRQGA